MKKTILALACMAAATLFTACGGGSKKSADGTAETKTETKAQDEAMVKVSDIEDAKIELGEGVDASALPDVLKKAVGKFPKISVSKSSHSEFKDEYAFKISATGVTEQGLLNLLEYYKSQGATVENVGAGWDVNFENTYLFFSYSGDKENGSFYGNGIVSSKK